MLLLLLALVVGTALAQVDESLLPYGMNPPRVNPEYCVGKAGFRITYPTEYGKALQYGEIAHVNWEVDHKNMVDPPDLITRIRILNTYQRNVQNVGENITIYTDGSKGAAAFPILSHDATGLMHYRIMVNYPGKAVHCVYESVPFVIAARTFERYTMLDTPPPKFARANAVSIKEAVLNDDGNYYNHHDGYRNGYDDYKSY